jgi:hydroxymethylpyrimidine pyrophosphatase-like HAD family hydrolase
MMNHDISYEGVRPFIFDVDGVLTNTGQTITKEFQEYFLSWMKHHPTILVTGSEHHKTREQVGDAIVDEALLTFNCMGNSIWMNGEEILHINPIHLTKQENLWLHHEITLMQFPLKQGNHIEYRRGSINVSFTGRPASHGVRSAFKVWDEQHEYRKRLIDRFNASNPRLEAFIGGDTSIDICLKHCNKGQLVNTLPTAMKRHEFIFFGDKCFPGGIDYPLAVYGEFEATVHEVSGYQDTWRILQEVYS